MRGAKLGWISDLYVAPGSRRGGMAGTLAREATAQLRAHGAEVVELEVQASNADARAVYERWGFRESKLILAAAAGELEERLSRDGAAAVARARVRADGRRADGRSGSAHVPPAARIVAADGRPRAEERLGRGRRRALQRRPAAPPPTRAGAFLSGREASCWRSASSRARSSATSSSSAARLPTSTRHCPSTTARSHPETSWRSTRTRRSLRA